MVPAFRDDNPLVRPFTLDCIDQPMFPGDAARPPALPIPSQRFRLAGPLKWSPLDLIDQSVDVGSDIR